MRKILWLFVVLFGFNAVAFSQTTSEPVSAALISEEKTIQADQTFWLAVKFTIARDFHLYWKNPASAGAAPKISWKLPDAFSVDEVLWPTPARIEVDNQVIYGYSNSPCLLAKIHAPKSLKEGATVTFEAEVSWVACGVSVCIPGKALLDVSLKATSQTHEVNEANTATFLEARHAIPKDDVPYSVETNDTSAQITLSLANEPLSEVHSVSFFPLVNGLFDTKVAPSWKVEDNAKNLVVQLHAPAAAALKGKVKGVLVVYFATDSLQRDLSINIDDAHMLGYHQKASGAQGGAGEGEGEEENVFLDDVKGWFDLQVKHFKGFFNSDFTYILTIAFLGGIILNFMPCVLPVISLKVLHFIQMQGQGRSTTFKHGLAFSFGILFSFWMLAGAIYLLQAFGKTVGWGFQLQEPLFVASLIVVLFILALSLFGVFEFGATVASFAGSLDESAKKSSPFTAQLPSNFSSFCSGILATFVASPCTGPLLGSAIGFTATLDPLYSLTIFTCLGAGMAFPYLFLSIFPELTRLIPRPGRWMITFKQLMGFLLMATVLWLIWVLEAETTNLSLVYLFTSFFFISIGLWIYGTWGGFERKSVVRSFAKLFALSFIALGVYLLLDEVYLAKYEPLVAKTQAQALEPKAPGTEWEPFSQERIKDLQSQHQPVFVDFSAKWCLTCQANSLVLQTDAVKEAFIQYGIVKMIGDWTQNDETITKFLRSLGRNGVPVYVLYGKNPGEAPYILPEVLTPEMVIEALKQVHEEKVK